jgi:hypothetical protein
LTGCARNSATKPSCRAASRGDHRKPTPG